MRTYAQDTLEWEARQPKPSPTRLSSGVIEREVLPHVSLDVGVATNPGPYSYEMLLIGRRRGEDQSDVAVVLSAYERATIHLALKHYQEFLEKETGGRKGILWNMVEGFFDTADELTDRLEHIKDFVESTRKEGM